MKYILTHPGGAHKDDFLATSLLIYRYGVPVVRRDPSEEELEDVEVCVVDVGNQHCEETMNFDHHHFAPDHPPTCALSLVLGHLGLYDDARSFCDWLETSEWLDTRGPVKTANWLGIDRGAMAKLNSPVDITMLRRFAKATEHRPSEPIYEVMRMIGEDLVLFLQGMRARMEEVAQQAEVWEVSGDLKVLFMPRTEPLAEEPSAGLGRYIEAYAPACVGMVYPDRRGNGYGLTRYNDDLRLDFTRIESCEDVHFAHKAGFVAKSSATDLERLRELLKLAWLGE